MLQFVHMLFFAGETEIGSITFYMSVTLNDTNVKSQITELTRLIAQELHVNCSQVASTFKLQ